MSSASTSTESQRIYGGLGKAIAREKLTLDPTYKQEPKDFSSILDDSASGLFVTEVFRGMAYTIKAFFDPKVTVRAVFALYVARRGLMQCVYVAIHWHCQVSCHLAIRCSLDCINTARQGSLTPPTVTCC